MYVYQNGAYQSTSDSQKGRTIREKLQIISTDEADNVWACIRVSSNWFVATAYFYLDGSFNLPFHISQLDAIS
jgi:hypothetical protein